MRVDVGVKAEFMDMFGASFSSNVGWRVSQSVGDGYRLSVGERFGMKADPEMYGPYHGAVVLYWGCFDTYTYEVNDPSGLASEMDGETFVLSVPVGGSTSVWSISRYNALAEALGTMPVLDIPYAVGDVDSVAAGVAKAATALTAVALVAKALRSTHKASAKVHM